MKKTLFVLFFILLSPLSIAQMADDSSYQDVLDGKVAFYNCPLNSSKASLTDGEVGNGQIKAFKIVNGECKQFICNIESTAQPAGVGSQSETRGSIRYELGFETYGRRESYCNFEGSKAYDTDKLSLLSRDLKDEVSSSVSCTYTVVYSGSEERVEKKSVICTKPDSITGSYYVKESQLCKLDSSFSNRGIGRELAKCELRNSDELYCFDGLSYEKYVSYSEGLECPSQNSSASSRNEPKGGLIEGFKSWLRSKNFIR